jgi:uncharacterized protein YdeI (YjbR/CyaY-like superfamily)
MNEVPSNNMQEFCSQKLWEMVSNKSTTSTPDELQAAIDELAERRHYLHELETLGKLSAKP